MNAKSCGALVCAVTFLTGCAALESLGRPAAPATTPDTTETQVTEAQAPPSVVDEIYAEIDGAVVAFGESLQLLEGGSTEAAERLLNDSLAALDDLSARCGAIEGCDLGVALSAYQEITSAQSALFQAGGEDDESLSSETEPVAVPKPVASTLLNGTELTELIQLNHHVRDALNGWLTWNRPLLMATYENYQYLRSEMAPAFDAANVPEALLFGILAVESGGRVHSFSRVGAAGPLQFMRATGSRYGLRTGGSFDERLDPARAARASVDYLNDQLRQLDNSLEKVLAAYNSGENRLKRLNRRLRGADFWSSEFYYALPRDTRDYVPKVLAAAWLYLHPERYNLEFPAIDTELTELTLAFEMSLGEVAICLGNDALANGWFRTLRNLNPRIKPEERVEAGATLQVPMSLAVSYEAHCTAENPELLARAEELYDATYAQGDELLPYVVQNGDTLSRIASRHRCMSMREIAAMNNIPAPRYPLRAGKTIKVPNC
ncbi:MAG: transglycosylase SLT domain-containing protein [Pseudomonadota bacterium]